MQFQCVVLDQLLQLYAGFSLLCLLASYLGVPSGIGAATGGLS